MKVGKEECEVTLIGGLVLKALICYYITRLKLPFEDIFVCNEKYKIYGAEKRP